MIQFIGSLIYAHLDRLKAFELFVCMHIVLHCSKQFSVSRSTRHSKVSFQRFYFELIIPHLSVTVLFS